MRQCYITLTDSRGNVTYLSPKAKFIKSEYHLDWWLINRENVNTRLEEMQQIVLDNPFEVLTAEGITSRDLTIAAREYGTGDLVRLIDFTLGDGTETEHYVEVTNGLKRYWLGDTSSPMFMHAKPENIPGRVIVANGECAVVEDLIKLVTKMWRESEFHNLGLDKETTTIYVRRVCDGAAIRTVHANAVGNIIEVKACHYQGQYGYRMGQHGYRTDHPEHTVYASFVYGGQTFDCFNNLDQFCIRKPESTELHPSVVVFAHDGPERETIIGRLMTAARYTVHFYTQGRRSGPITLILRHVKNGDIAETIQVPMTIEKETTMNMPTPADFVLPAEHGKPVVENWLKRISEKLFDMKGKALDQLVFGKGLAVIISYSDSQMPLNGEIMAEVSARMRDYGWHINFSHSGPDDVTITFYPLA